MVTYKIENLLTGDLYIGSTNNFLKRQQYHKAALRKGIHHSIVLQRAWNKYGEEAFEFLVIETYTTRAEAFANEQKLINTLEPKYNVSNTVFAVYRRGIPVIQFNLEGQFIKDWESATEAANELKINASDIIQCCKGKKYRVGNYYFSYKNSPVTRKQKITKEQIRERNKKNRCKKYLVVHPDGRKEIITGLKKFCEENGLHYPSAHQVVLGTRGRKTHKGFKFEKYG